TERTGGGPIASQQRSAKSVSGPPQRVRPIHYGTWVQEDSGVGGKRYPVFNSPCNSWLANSIESLPTSINRWMSCFQRVCYRLFHKLVMQFMWNNPKCLVN